MMKRKALNAKPPTAKPPAALEGEDRILWEKVARSVTPLGPRPRFGGEAQADTMAALMDEAMLESALVNVPPPHAAPALAAGRKPKPARLASPEALDPATQKKIAKGRLVIEARIDLHGMTQDEAHGLLLSFIERAAQRHLRTVLVITGKGRSPRSEGALKRAVPLWLAQPAFARHVSGHADAAQGHGGAGALYVRLRKPAGSAD
ncbi:MAG: Smr/MutS family protein [Rhizobiaceae bacterium]|jgi:DNA-nicking Smr family endonuclease|nr:Smr/MutS family protein [Rhizobiaceae bacterium]